jgi:hypothetical protein
MSLDTAANIGMHWYQCHSKQTNVLERRHNLFILRPITKWTTTSYFADHCSCNQLRHRSKTILCGFRTFSRVFAGGTTIKNSNTNKENQCSSAFSDLSRINGKRSLTSIR